MRRSLLAVISVLAFTGPALAQERAPADEVPSNEASWLRTAAREGSAQRSSQGVAWYLTRVVALEAEATTPALFVDLPGGGRVVALSPARETKLVRIPADRPVRLSYGDWKVLEISVFDEKDRKLFEGAVARPLARMYLNVRPDWDDVRSAAAAEVLSLIARAASGNDAALDAARKLPAQQDDRVAQALLAEVLGRAAPRGALEPCTEEEIGELLGRLKGLAFDDKRNELLESHASGHRYTCAQVVRVAKLFSFDEGKLKAIGLVNARIVDRKNFVRLYDVFSFDSARDELRKLERQFPADAGAAPTACPDVELEEILARLRKASFDDGRAKTLESAATERGFTCAQVVQLVKTFSFGDGQVNAVRILNPRIVDRQNFFKIYDAFTFDSDKDRVRAIEKEPRR
jgi:hypothetical protein